MQDISHGVYLHVPFCARTCAYCKFYKRAPSSSDMEAYIDALSLEVGRFLDSPNSSAKIDTMFWGGGTPSCLSERHIEKIAKILEPLKPTLEWTVEVAPSTASESKLKLLRELGVDRISVGIQSFNEKTLKSLGRPHSEKSALLTLERAYSAGFPKLGIDLIFGAPEQTLPEWESDLKRASELPINHLSTYCLEFESSTSCCGGIAKGDYDKLEREGEFLNATMSELPELGFPQYEISNYAKPGFECLHNISTWKMFSWRGFGPAAASQWSGKRFRNKPDMEIWRTSQINGDDSCLEDLVELDDEELFSSALIFGLRMREGVDISEIAKRFPSANPEKYEASLEFLESKNLVAREGPRVRLTREGVFVADSVAVELL